MAEMNRFGRWAVNRRTQARARRVLNRLPSDFRIATSSRVLELGSGGGGMVALVYETFHPTSVVATDFDAAQVSATRTLLMKRWGTLPSNVEVRQADALVLPFEDASFDDVFALMMLHHVEGHFSDFAKRPQALREIRRVLRPGGRLIYSEIFQRDKIRETLVQLGFKCLFLKSARRSDLAVFELPG